MFKLLAGIALFKLLGGFIGVLIVALVLYMIFRGRGSSVR
ncbi:MAG: hypothetical protein NVS2B7_19900 [Herpetosiphon sp.]